MTHINISRRAFIVSSVAAGGGLMLGFHIPSAMAAAVNAELASAGLTVHSVGRIGHALGLLSTEPPDVSPTDQTILESGMVLTIEPTVIRDDGIYEVEQDVVVTETGCEILSKSPPHLRVLGSGA